MNGVISDLSNCNTVPNCIILFDIFKSKQLWATRFDQSGLYLRWHHRWSPPLVDSKPTNFSGEKLTRVLIMRRSWISPELRRSPPIHIYRQSWPLRGPGIASSCCCVGYLWSNFKGAFEPSSCTMLASLQVGLQVGLPKLVGFITFFNVFLNQQPLVANWPTINLFCWLPSF